MKIRIRDVVKGGIKVEHIVKAQDIGLVDEEFIEPDSALKVVADLQKVDEFILAKAVVTFVCEYHCARCLERFSREVSLNCDIDLEVMPGDEWLDLGARVREELLLEYFPRTLCREDCKGICPDCGADLNTEQCECKKDKN